MDEEINKMEAIEEVLDVEDHDVEMHLLDQLQASQRRHDGLTRSRAHTAVGTLPPRAPGGQLRNDGFASPHLAVGNLNIPHHFAATQRPGAR